MSLTSQTHVRDRTNDVVTLCPPQVFSVSPRLGGSFEEASSARPFRGSGTGVTVLMKARRGSPQVGGKTRGRQERITPLDRVPFNG